MFYFIGRRSLDQSKFTIIHPAYFLIIYNICSNC